MTALILVETVLLAVLTVLVAGLLRAYGTVLARLHQLDGGRPRGARTFELTPVASAPSASQAPTPAARAATATGGPGFDVAGESPSGELVSARVVGVEHDTLLLFLSSGCSSCETFWTELARPVPLPGGTRVLVVAQDAAVESVADLQALAPDGVDVVLSSEAWAEYAVPGSPHVVFVEGPSGRVRGEGTGQSLNQVVELLGRSDANAATGPRLAKSARDAEQEGAVDRELLAAGIAPGDPRLYGAD